MTRSIQSAAAVAAALAVLAGCDESILPTTERAVAPGTASFAISVGEPVLLTYFGSNDEGVAAAVNNSGTAVGYVYDSAGTYHPILWAPGGTAVRLGTDACPGRHPTAALGVNDAGQVVGMGFCDGDQDYTNMAVLWTAAGTHQPLGTMYDIFGESVATGINNNGHVVGWSASAPHRGFPGAFRWTAATGMQPLEWLVSYYESESGAYAVNDAGTVVGYSEIEYGEFEYRTVAVLWSAGGGIRAVAGYGSVAHDINEQGEVVGVMEVNGKQHAFRWTAAGGLVDMGPGSAYGINNYGVIVGTGSTVGAAWVWTQETGFIALPGSSPAAYDIGDDGTVVGRVGRRAAKWKLGGMPVTAPARPSSPVAVAGYSPTRVTLSWTDGSFNETSFAIRRRAMNADGTWGAYVVLRQAGANATSITDSSVVLNTTYQYRVSACNSAGCSATVASGYVSPVTLPTAPTNLSAAAVTGTRLNVTWTDASNNESNFPVRRREKNPDGSWTAYVKLADRPASSTSYTDTAAVSGRTYMYQVNVCNAVGCVAGPVSAEATTPTLPAPPGGVAATAVSATQVNVSWTDQSGNETAFKLWRRASNGDGTWGAYVALPDAGANATSSADTGMPAGATYQYRVRACNAAGCSVGVNSAGVTVPAS